MGETVAEKGARRRRERERAARHADPARRRRMRNVWLAVGLVVAGGALAIVLQGGGPKDCPGHWHATLAVHVDGQRVQFPQPPYNYEGDRTRGQLPLSMHMHQGNPEQLHFEPSVKRCRGLENTLRLLGIELEADAIAFVGAHEDAPYAGEHRNEGNRTVRVVIESVLGEVQEVPVAAALGRQLRDGDKCLVLYGAYTEQQVQDMLDALASPVG